MRRGVWVSLAFAIGIMLVATATGAAASGGSNGTTVARFAHIDPSLLSGFGKNGRFVPASLSNKPVSVMVQVAGSPVAAQDAASKQQGLGPLTKAQKAAIRQQLASKQAPVADKVKALGGHVVGQLQDAYNGVQAIVAEKDVSKLAAISGVTAVHAIRTFKPSNVNGVPFIGAPTVWGDGTTGYTGLGVKVGIIDTGVDYTHADFGGPGTTSAYQAALATDTAPANPSWFGPSAPKVKGGFDFAGDAYNADDPTSQPQPDPNPLDCNDHGTHTAGTLAGFGVLADGSTYTGPWNSSAVTIHDPSNKWKVGPGVAPQADIYEYKVFGCAGSTNVVPLAINKAVQDGVSVISMSLGSDLGGTTDPTSVAAQNAVDDGISVVASAGNAGPSGYIVGSPSTASGVLSVAAMDASVPTYPGADIGTSPVVHAIDANGAPIPAGTYPVKVLRNSDGSVSLGCDKSEYAGTAGDIVVTMRGTCARVARAVFGDEAGAAAVVMINSDDTLPPFEGQITSDPDTGEQHTVTIPFLGVRSSDGPTLVAADGTSVSLSSATVQNTNYQHVASFSSGGPRNPDSAPKPDVIAPGVSVISAGMGTGNGPLVDSGTSMACPMTAGVAALVKQAHPSWNGLQIKAAIMNTADPSLNLGYNTRLAGTGVVQAPNAVKAKVLAQTNDELDGLAYGAVSGSGNYGPAPKAFTLTNTSGSSVTYNLSVSPNGSLRGATFSLPSSVTVPANSSKTVQVSLSIPASAFAALPSDDTGVIGPGGVLTVKGTIVATPANAANETLRVPFMVVPRGLSNVVAGNPTAFTKVKHATQPGENFTATLPLTNSGIHDGTADLYAWGIHDANDSGQPMDVRDVGVEEFPGSDFGVSDSDRGLVFDINTYAPATNQTVNEYDVDIDTNGDGQVDAAVVGVDLGAVTAGAFNGQMASFTFAEPSGDLIDAFLADAPMNGTTIELPAIASELGITDKGGPKKQQFTYTVNAFSIVPGTFVDTTGTAVFNPFQPAVSSGDFATIPAGTSTSIPLTINKQSQQKTPALGWLVASVDDASGPAQADEVPAPNAKSLK